MNPLKRWGANPDAVLVGRVRKGSHDAYGELVRRHQEILYRHVRGMGLEHDVSLDIVQDAFIKGYARLDECRDPEHFRAWLFKIVRNLCLDYLKNIRRPAVSLSDVPEGALRMHGDPEVMLSVNEAMDRLPPALREAFMLKHDAGYTYEEIADITGASPSAVKMRVHRAREALQGLLMEQSPDAEVTIRSA